MPRALLALTALAAGLQAATVLTQHDGRIDVAIDDKPFTSLYYGPEAPKPYLHPLRSASGKIVTRVFPMENVPGETKDQHHRGLWIGYKDINGVEFWENEFSYNRPNAGKVVTRSIDLVRPDTIRATFAWLDHSGEPMLEEQRTMTFSGTPATREINIDLTFRALVKTTFGDSKDGFFAVRLTDALAETKTGVITNSSGGRTMNETWGKPAGWVDYTGVLDGEKLGVTVFEDPKSFQYPPRWHVRDYGLLAANPFGAHAYDPEAAKSPVTLESGQSVHLRYRVLIHGQSADEKSPHSVPR
jgi:hypothetical protein